MSVTGAGRIARLGRALAALVAPRARPSFAAHFDRAVAETAPVALRITAWERAQGALRSPGGERIH